MPSEKSLYHKVQLILQHAASSEAANLDQLSSEIQARRLPNFNTLQYDEKRDTFLWRQSARVVKRTVGFCRRLDLIDDNAHLTRDGRQALRKTLFDTVLSRKIRDILDRAVGIDKVNQVIQECLHRNPPELPTANRLRSALAPDMVGAEFARLLTLLSHCGAAESSQAKLYLRIAPD